MEILPCPRCHNKGKVYVEDVHSEEIYAYVGCNTDGCGFYVADVRRPKTTTVAKELLKIAAIRKWNAAVKTHKEKSGV